MLVVNMFGGASSGKTTTALMVTSLLKEAGLKVEYVPESIKGMIWDNNEEALKNQVLITAMHEHAIRRLNGKIDIVVTDSPIISGYFYNEALGTEDTISSHLSRNLYESYDNISFVLPPRTVYNQEGRFKDPNGEIQKKVLESSIRYLRANAQKAVVFNIESEREKYPTMIVDIIKKELFKRENYEITYN